MNTIRDLSSILVLVGCFFWTWREIVRRWSLFIIWGWNGQWKHGFKCWRAYRLTGTMPVGPDDFDMDAWIKENGRAHLVWTLFGSSAR